MQYMGGKHHSAKGITEAILTRTGNSGEYWEPFLGGGAVASLMAPNFEVSHFSDYHAPLIRMWEAVYAGYRCFGDPLRFFPEYISRDDYEYHKNAPMTPAQALIGFGAGFSGRYFSGFSDVDKRSDISYYQAARRGIARKAQQMFRNVNSVRHCSYADISPEPGDTVYCDPPYAGTAKYSTGDFDSLQFWEWCRELTRRGVHVYVSEYNAPDDFTCIWEKQKRVTFNRNSNTNKALERLFVYAI